MMGFTTILLQGGDDMKKFRKLKRTNHSESFHADFLDVNNKYKDNKAKDVDMGINNMGLK